MRRVHELAERKRRYTALATSIVAALLLWLLGAVVFMQSEKPQGYTYFAWLYFAYTSLLTVGYGDLVVQSNSGKAFFVFWSLLAVPTLTILISNMGDTIIKAFKDFTIWIGSFTVLPDENGLASAVKVGIGRMKRGKVWKEKALDHKDTPGASERRGLDRVAEHVEEEELGQAEESGKHGDYLERDIHFYHFVLAKEVRQMLSDMQTSPPRQYTYEEWTYYLRLLGQNEEDASGHRRPEDQHQHSKGDAPDIGTADDGDDINWSWLGIRSPLMGNTNESEWLLQRLATKLEAEMRKLSSPNEKERTEKPPISMADMKKHNQSGKSNGVGKLEKDVETAEVRHEEHTS
jgi:potassium channel subfamily K